jgi:DNA polymerase III alpha subunit (gram-positive type)
VPNQPFSVDWEKVLYVVFDLETTGLSRKQHEIIELAAVILDHNGIQIEDASFVQLVKPTNPIPSFITTLTSITNDDVRDADNFKEVGGAFLRFMQQHADEYGGGGSVDHILLVGHNARVFDIPFLMQQLHVHNIHETLLTDKRFGYGLDTMRIAKESMSQTASVVVPSAYNLKTLFQFVTGRQMENCHRALDDVKATICVLRFEAFWRHRHGELFYVRQEAPSPPGGDDSDDDGTALSSSSEDDDEVENVPLGNRWEQGINFTPGYPDPGSKFQQYFTT